MKKLLLVLAALNLIGFGGCSKTVKDPVANTTQQVNGQIFVVTKGAQSIKLGSITVSATPEQDVLPCMAVKDTLVEGMKPSLEKDVKEAEKAYLLAEKTNRQLQAHWQDIFTRNLGRDYGPAGNAAVPYSKLLASDKEMHGKKSDLTRAQQRLHSFPTAEFLFERIPEGPYRSVTDADGNFLLDLPKPGKYAVAAHASRQVGSEKEEYFWLVWLTVGSEMSRRLLLTNSNLVTSKSPDSVFEADKASFNSSN